MEIGFASEKLVVGRRNPAPLPDDLRAPFVHRERAPEHARSGVGDSEELERALDRAVLAVAAVQRDKDAVEPLFDKCLESPLLGIECVRIDTFFLQSGQDHCAALERNGSLRGTPAHHHGDLSKVARPHAASPMILTSGTSSMPNRSFTALRACSISASMSEARAFPFGLTMKFACFSEIRAPPISWPLSPQASIRRAAYFPGGLRNTEPAFGSSRGCSAIRFASSSLMRARARFSSPAWKRNQAARNHSFSPSFDPRRVTRRYPISKSAGSRSLNSPARDIVSTFATTSHVSDP